MPMLGAHVVGELEVKVLDYINTHGSTEYLILCRELRIPKSGVHSLMTFLRRKRLLEEERRDRATITQLGKQILDLAKKEACCAECSGH